MLNEQQVEALVEISDELEVIGEKLKEYGEGIHKEAAMFYADKLIDLKYRLDELPGGEKMSIILVRAIVCVERKLKDLMND